MGEDEHQDDPEDAAGPVAAAEPGADEERPSPEVESPGIWEQSNGPETSDFGARLTLSFKGPPLALPNEDPDLPLPTAHTGAGANAFVRASSSPAGDAWTRDRLARSSDIHALMGAAPHIPALDIPAAPSIPSDLTSDLPEPAALDAPEDSNAMGLVDRRRPSRPPPADLVAEMTGCYELGDFTGALRAAELVLGGDAANIDARRCADASRQRLMLHYASQIGSEAVVLRVAVPEAEVRWLGLNHRQSLLLARVDGKRTVDEIVHMDGMEPLEALKLLTELYEAGTLVA